jgi:hypothetical protein
MVKDSVYMGFGNNAPVIIKKQEQQTDKLSKMSNIPIICFDQMYKLKERAHTRQLR